MENGWLVFYETAGICWSPHACRCIGGGPSVAEADSHPLPPSGRVAHPMFDPEMTAMLPRAAVTVEWSRPNLPHPICPALYGWYTELLVRLNTHLQYLPSPRRMMSWLGH